MISNDNSIKVKSNDVISINYESIDDSTELYYPCNENGDFIEDFLFEERSHGSLKHSFRMIKDEKGNPIKIIFDLNQEDVVNVGPNYNRKHQNLSDIKSKIKRTGHNDFTSTGTVKAIIDMKTGNRLNSVIAIGQVDGFRSHPTKYIVGQKETIPSYKATGRTHNKQGEYDTSKENIQNYIDSPDGRGYKKDYGFIRKARHLETNGAPSKQQRKVDVLMKKWKDEEKSLLQESVETPEYNTDMTESQAKKTIRNLSQSLINDIEKDKNKKVTQYTANIYANIITKNLLPKWAKGFKKVKINLDSYQSFNTFEFIPPTMGQDFVSRFINGRESLNGLLHRSPEIKIKMSPRIFHTMENPDDAYNFFKAAIQYYDSKVEKSGNRLMSEVMKLGHNMKHLIGNSKLSGLVTYPLSLLFVFDDVKMSNKETFKISEDDIQTINKFVRNISSRYAAPEREKKQIVEDMKDMVKELREACEMTETMKELSYLPEAVDKLFFGGYNDLIVEASRLFIEDQIDREDKPTTQVRYIREKFGVKKLKKIPSDLIAYISIETENIKNVNDKMMISSYCLGKIEIVEWYIELLEVGSNKYIVPHTKPYLETMRTQLLACFKKIMNTPIPQTNRSIINIQYPKGYEG